MSALNRREVLYTASQETQTIPGNLKPGREKVWLGLYFPKIALTSAQLTAPAEQSVPLVIVEQFQNQTRVYCASQSARIQGIEPGLPLNAAYVLCRDLKVVFRNETAEQKQLQLYANRMACFTPQIVLSGTDVILLEVSHSLRLFDGLKNLYTQLKHCLLDTPHSISCAPVAASAELMVRNNIEKVISHRERLQSALGSILIRCAAISPALSHRLERCGLSCLRDIWRLPRSDLARRFGPDLLTYLDELSGQLERPQPIFEPEYRFREKYAFEQEIELAMRLRYAAESLLLQAQNFMQARTLLTEKIVFRLVYTHRRGEDQKWMKLSIFAQQGGDTPAHFLPQLDEQLQRLELEHPVVKIELQIDRFKLRHDCTRDLFRQGQQSTESWSMLLDILVARLGQKYVYRLLSPADHRPEKAWHKVKACSSSKAVAGQSSRPLRPIWLLRQPVKRPGQGFKLISDAERLESGWWSGEDIRREYYLGVAPSGQRCWLYRDLKARGNQWYLHGLFA